ncbi:MarR family transcriptional regulator for hemolysin [Anaerosolibacter carboniphilus]|uniref:MarR family transcriptional regulator for hemolysin n=1 Tax=Anaerosolibacter carboniphilus TaxID=1417629 RepID=A0A841L0I1_9FIRM|nr:MarR family transcriptional regulator [Anaerosolibacter carboniphilus]MBB6215899.1 MarR family transcriptional regulator for hemolysin [Anaerosolibacter carboniphilus]
MERMMNDLGYLINKAARLTKWELKNKLSDVGLTSSQFAVIREIGCNECKSDNTISLSPAAIAERLHSDRPTISGIIQRLTNQGWVRRTENPNDRRSQIIVLTEKSKELMENFESLSNEAIKRGIWDFKEEEIENLKGYLRRIIDNFS